MLQKTILSLSGNTIRNYRLEYYVSKFNSGRPFSFARYGDGEWNAMLNVEGANCDGHAYFPELGEDLRKTLFFKGAYYYGLQPRAIRSMRKQLQVFLTAHHLSVQWHNADVFHDANVHGKLFPLIAALRSRDVVMIGPSHLRALGERVFSFKEFIEIPLRNCYLAKEEIQKRILEIAAKRKATVYAFSASMTTKTLIHALFPIIGKTNWMIDFGSLWDIYVGVKSRNVYSKRDWTSRIEKNLNRGHGLHA